MGLNLNFLSEEEKEIALQYPDVLKEIEECLEAQKCQGTDTPLVTRKSLRKSLFQKVRKAWMRFKQIYTQ